MSMIVASRTIAHMSDSIRPVLERHGSASLVVLAMSVTICAISDLATIGLSRGRERVTPNRHQEFARDLYKNRHDLNVPPEFIRFVWSVGSVLNWAALEAKKAS